MIHPGRALPVLLCVALMGCGRLPIAETSEAINTRNDPARIEPTLLSDLNHKLDEIPATGRSAKPVWFGSWWPASDRGTAAVMKKYDLAMDRGNLAEAWELESAASQQGVSWAGHCNGLAVASINEPEPRKPVTYNGVTFDPDEIKGLLVEAYQGTLPPIVGGRCNAGHITTDQYGRPVESWCRDLNAGSFHVALGNFLGMHGLPVIFDVSLGEQIWNFAATSYSMAFSEISMNEAIDLTSPGSAAYVFNDNAKRFVSVSTNVRFASGSQRSYSYVLELDQDGHVIGGEWIGTSHTDHPDFVWRSSVAIPENPHLSLPVIQEIARQSI